MSLKLRPELSQTPLDSNQCDGVYDEMIEGEQMFEIDEDAEMPDAGVNESRRAFSSSSSSGKPILAAGAGAEEENEEEGEEDYRE